MYTRPDSAPNTMLEAIDLLHDLDQKNPNEDAKKAHNRSYAILRDTFKLDPHVGEGAWDSKTGDTVTIRLLKNMLKAPATKHTHLIAGLNWLLDNREHPSNTNLALGVGGLTYSGDAAMVYAVQLPKTKEMEAVLDSLLLALKERDILVNQSMDGIPKSLAVAVSAGNLFFVKRFFARQDQQESLLFRAIGKKKYEALFNDEEYPKSSWSKRINQLLFSAIKIGQSEIVEFLIDFTQGRCLHFASNDHSIFIEKQYYAEPFGQAVKSKKWDIARLIARKLQQYGVQSQVAPFECLNHELMIGERSRDTKASISKVYQEIKDLMGKRDLNDEVVDGKQAAKEVIYAPLPQNAVMAEPAPPAYVEEEEPPVYDPNAPRFDHPSSLPVPGELVPPAYDELVRPPAHNPNAPLHQPDALASGDVAPPAYADLPPPVMPAASAPALSLEEKDSLAQRIRELGLLVERKQGSVEALSEIHSGYVQEAMKSKEINLIASLSKISLEINAMDHPKEEKINLDEAIRKLESSVAEYKRMSPDKKLEQQETLTALQAKLAIKAETKEQRDKLEKIQDILLDLEIKTPAREILSPERPAAAAPSRTSARTIKKV